jgi:hypothetical protein
VKCVDCHQAVGGVFYGKTAIGVKDSPSFKADVAGCRDCHSRILEGLESGFQQVKSQCIECHDRSYGDILSDWNKTAVSLIRELEPRISNIKREIHRLERKGKHTFVFTKLFGDAEHNFDLLKTGIPEHNLEYAEEVSRVTRQMLDEVEKLLAEES